MIYIILLLFSFTISSEFKLEDFYLFRDTEQRNLFRANLNLDNTVLSTEILYDGGSELGMNKREIILYGFNSMPVLPDSGYFFGRLQNDWEDITEIHDGYLVNWSKHDVEKFYYLHYEDSDESYINSQSGLELRKTAPIIELVDESIYKSLIPSSSNLLLDEEISAKKIYDYITINDYHQQNLGNKTDAHIITYLDNNDTFHIRSNYSYSKPKFFIPDNTLDSPNAIRVTRRGDNYDAVVTFNLSSDNEEDICYFCNVLKNGIRSELNRVTIYPRTDDYKDENGNFQAIRKQLQPRFSSNGRYLAFLSQNVIDDNRFDLYSFDTSEIFYYDTPSGKENYRKRKSICENREMVHDSLLTDRVIKLIDTNIVTFNDYEQLSQTAQDFDWHHNENIIFYIKENLNNEKVTYQLKSYNFRTSKYSLILENEYDMGYISLSNDSQFINFSFKYLDQIFKNCIGCEIDPYTQKIAVAKLTKVND